MFTVHIPKECSVPIPILVKITISVTNIVADMIIGTPLQPRQLKAIEIAVNILKACSDRLVKSNVQLCGT